MILKLWNCPKMLKLFKMNVYLHVNQVEKTRSAFPGYIVISIHRFVRYAYLYNAYVLFYSCMVCFCSGILLKFIYFYLVLSQSHPHFVQRAIMSLSFHVCFVICFDVQVLKTHHISLCSIICSVMSEYDRCCTLKVFS